MIFKHLSCLKHLKYLYQTQQSINGEALVTLLPPFDPCCSVILKRQDLPLQASNLLPAGWRDLLGDGRDNGSDHISCWYFNS